jgi:hypothetical protein
MDHFVMDVEDRTVGGLEGEFLLFIKVQITKEEVIVVVSQLTDEVFKLGVEAYGDVESSVFLKEGNRRDVVRRIRLEEVMIVIEDVVRHRLDGTETRGERRKRMLDQLVRKRVVEKRVGRNRKELGLFDIHRSRRRRSRAFLVDVHRKEVEGASHSLRIRKRKSVKVKAIT